MALEVGSGQETWGQESICDDVVRFLPRLSDHTPCKLMRVMPDFVYNQIAVYGIMCEVVNTSLAPAHETDCEKECQRTRSVDVYLPCDDDDAPIPGNRTRWLRSTIIHCSHFKAYMTDS